MNVYDFHLCKRASDCLETVPVLLLLNVAVLSYLCQKSGLKWLENFPRCFELPINFSSSHLTKGSSRIVTNQLRSIGQSSYSAIRARFSLLIYRTTVFFYCLASVYHAKIKIDFFHFQPFASIPQRQIFDFQIETLLARFSTSHSNG